MKKSKPTVYKRKPIAVEAYQYVAGDKNAPVEIKDGKSYISTLEGELEVAEGDWIVKGVEGEFYAVKPAIFKKTYEVAGIDSEDVDPGDLTADLQRLQAEFANYKRREEGVKAELLEIAKREVITLLLPTLDNIERALTHRPDELKDNVWAGGVEAVGKQAQEALTKMGVTRIKTVGEPFDHNLHEAISMDDGDGDTEVVTEELQAGYRMGERVIRHAMVKVGRK